MKWNDKTPKQYDAYATLVMGGENDKEIHLDEDEFSVIWGCLDTVKQLIDEVPDHMMIGRTHSESGKTIWKA